MRLIDADELTAEIQSMSLTISGEDVFPQSAKDSVLAHIGTQPTIDAVPAEQCEDEPDEDACDFAPRERYVEYVTCTYCGRTNRVLVCYKAFLKEPPVCPECGARTVWAPVQNKI